MSNILDQIVSAKTNELEERKRSIPLKLLQEWTEQRQATVKFSSVFPGDGVSLIAEIKKASPSRGLLMPNFSPTMLANIYIENGARALSVLTDRRFQGKLKHLDMVKKIAEERSISVLRKDFIFDPYQVYEARAYGADALLLIAAILSAKQISNLLDLCHKIGLEALRSDKVENKRGIIGDPAYWLSRLLLL